MGEELGFHTETGYTSPEENAITEAAWALNSRQKPVYSFAVEEADPMRLAASTLQWVGSSTEPKSWMHICIFSSGSADALASFPLPRSVKIYDRRNLPRLHHDLEGLTEKMTHLLRTYTDDEPGGDSPSTVRRLSLITTEWPKGMLSPRLSLKGRTAFDGGLSLFAAEGVEDDETDVPALKPSRKVVPLEILGGNVSFEGALMRLTEAQGENLVFSTEHRNYPFIFHLSAKGGGGASKLCLWFDVDKSNIPQALMFREFAEDVVSSKTTVFVGSTGEFARVSLD